MGFSTEQKNWRSESSAAVKTTAMETAATHVATAAETAAEVLARGAGTATWMCKAAIADHAVRS